MALDFVSRDRFVAVESFALLEPPTWTRLEPQSAAGDPRPGIEARTWINPGDYGLPLGEATISLTHLEQR